MGLFSVLRGRQAEDAAALLLARSGYRVLIKNYRTKGGEIDIVAMHKDTLCFVEVRMRSRAIWGRADETISPAKRRRIAHAAAHYLAAHGDVASCRFDVVALDGDHASLIPDAFRLE